MIKLENEKYRVTFSRKAAEITSFYDKDLDIEYMWQGDPTYWSGRNPILFPIIGSSYDQKYHFNGRSSEMGNHGFLRHATFELLREDPNEIVMEYVSDDESFRLFPYYFRIQVSYRLKKNKLVISYRIYNEGVVDLYANFGLHPAFNCPLQEHKSFEDYNLTFSPKQHLLGSGPYVGETVEQIPLDYKLFEEHPTFMYYNLKGPFIGFTDGKHGVRITTVGYPITAVWTPKAPFICLEPWNGMGKVVEKDLDFKDRDATLKIGPERHRLFTYTIEVH